MSKILDAIESTTKEIEALKLKLDGLKVELKNENKAPFVVIEWLESLGFVEDEYCCDYRFTNRYGAQFLVNFYAQDNKYSVRVFDEWDNIIAENEHMLSSDELKTYLLFELSDKVHKNYSFTFSGSALSKEAFMNNVHSYLDDESYDVDSVVEVI